MLNRLKVMKYPSKRLSVVNDRELILSFQNGDINSFSPIYSRFHKPILKFVLNQIKTVHVAEEITQDIFLKIYQYKSSYNPEYEVSTWIWTIARNTVYDHLRKTKAADQCISESIPVTEFTESELITPETAESLMIEGFDKKQLLELMATLSVKQKEAIFLRLVKKFSYQEISKSMNLSLSAVKSLINRGKTSLMKLHSEPKTT